MALRKIFVRERSKSVNAKEEVREEVHRRKISGEVVSRAMVVIDEGSGAGVS